MIRSRVRFVHSTAMEVHIGSGIGLTLTNTASRIKL